MKNKNDWKELKELFAEIKCNNNIAFEKLYTNYSKLIYKIAYSIVKNRNDAEDIVQIVFEKLYSIDESNLPDNNEASWIYSVTKNEAINYLKKNKNSVDLSSVGEVEDKNDNINEIMNMDSYNRLISKLNDKEKEIVSLKLLSNLSFSEIGKLLKEPTSTIKWRYYKSIHTLKLLLGNLGMSIITFVIGVKVLSNSKIFDESHVIKDNKTQTSKDNSKEESKLQESLKDEVKSDTGKMQNEQIHEVTEQLVNIKSINGFEICIFSTSFAFLIFAIFFSIIFTKHQLKRIKKLSK